MPTKTRRALREFTARLGRGQYLPQRRFIGDALRGLHISGDTMLSSWGRALREPRRLIHTEKRLSNGLKSKRLNDEELRGHALAIAGRLVRDHCTAVSVDGTDVCKTYATKMPFQGPVHDGSRGEVGNGWVVLRADGVAATGRHVPLHLMTYSRERPLYAGEHSELRRFLVTLQSAVPRAMPFVFDAGLDGRSYRQLFADLGLRMTTRLVLSGSSGLRRLFVDGKPHGRLGDVVSTLPAPLRFRASRFLAGAKQSWVVDVGWLPSVQLLGRRDQLEQRSYSLVVVRRADAPPLAVLTTDRVCGSDDARVVAERYFNRWAVEDGHRLLKTQFGLENVRVLTWVGLTRLIYLVHLAALFMVWLVYRRHGEELLRQAPAFGPVPRFPYYRLAAALAAVLA